MSKVHKNHLPFSYHPAMGRVVGISQHVCQQTYPSASDPAFVTEDAVPAGPRTTADPLQGRPTTASRALPLQARLRVTGSNSSSMKVKSLQPGHASAPFG